MIRTGAQASAAAVVGGGAGLFHLPCLPGHQFRRLAGGLLSGIYGLAMDLLAVRAHHVRLFRPAPAPSAPGYAHQGAAAQAGLFRHGLLLPERRPHLCRAGSGRTPGLVRFRHHHGVPGRRYRQLPPFPRQRGAGGTPLGPAPAVRGLQHHHVRGHGHHLYIHPLRQFPAHHPVPRHGARSAAPAKRPAPAAGGPAAAAGHALLRLSGAQGGHAPALRHGRPAHGAGLLSGHLHHRGLGGRRLTMAICSPSGTRWSSFP